MEREDQPADGRFEPFEGHRPSVESPSYVAPTARLIGRVRAGQHTSVWPGVVLRGDHESITIGRGTNIQDNTVVHPDPGEPVRIGDHVTIGHGAVIHACTIGHDVLIGIGAVILNRAVIGDGSVVGAGAVVA
ncbi:MAG TPA: gamma carbonic anhydrase family protein, partial [Bacillota bacterium]